MKNIVLVIITIVSFVAANLSYASDFDQQPTLTKPISFTENKGQIVDQNSNARPDVLFGGHSNGMTFHLRNSGISYQLSKINKTKEWIDPKTSQSTVIVDQRTIYRVDINWLNTNSNAQIIKGTSVVGFDNFYTTGKNEGILNVQSFEDVTYQNLYNGINLKWYQKDEQLKYDYICAAGSDYTQIKLQISGADQLFVDSDGNLIIETPLGKIIEQAPLVIQDGKKLKSEWILNDDILSFKIYDLNKNVSYIIDPIVRAWGTYYGTTSEEKSYSTKSDNNGNVYITGKTGDPASGITLATLGAHQTTFAGNTDCFLVKFNTSGVRQWGTYYGGTQEDYSVSCDIDSDNNVYIAGYTVSLTGEGIETSGSYQEYNFGNFDAFLVKFDPSGVRQWGTYFGGPGGDFALSCKTDLSNNIYLTGYTNSLSNISTYGVQQQNHATGASDNDGFLAKFNSSGSILWSRYFGGGNEDKFYSVATDKDKNVYITGETTSPFMANFSSHQSSIAGFNDAIIAKFDSTGIKSWCSYFGGSFNEVGSSCSVDTTGHVYMAGYTSSTNGIAYNGSGVYQESRQVAFGVDLFLTQFNTNNGTNNWGTYYGGDTDEEAGNCVTDLAGNTYICGTTVSTNGTSIASTGSYQSVHGGGSRDAFIAKIDTDGKRKWGTYYGNSGYDVGTACAIDRDTIVYLTGYTLSNTGFSTSGALQTTNEGALDGFLVKFSLCSSFTVTTDTSINVSCFGGSNGAITLNTPTGGTSPYTYEWSGTPDGDATLSILNLSAGAYTCDITDNEGCASQKTVSITEPSVLSSSISSQTNILCFGATTGAAVISVSGGTAPYSYSWSPSGGTTATISGKSAGTYTCTITDANGCTKTQNVTLTEPTGLSVNTSATPVSCNGGNNGTGLVTPNGGTAPYTYLWAHNSATISNQFGLSAGTYSCTVTDANSCSVLGFIVINEPLALTSSTVSVQNASCNGANNGSIEILVSGGNFPYNYSWSPSGGFTQQAQFLTAGAYTCTITDTKGCTKTHNASVFQPTIVSGTTTITNVSCNGGSNGAINLTPTGGVSPFSYNWGGGITTEDRTGLSAGSYSVTITDANGCFGTVPGNITQPTAIIASVSSQTNISCNGGSTGAATISASGGTGAFTYSWTPSGGTAATASGVTAGTYTCTITDANSCTKTQNVTITQPTAITSSVSSQSNVSCFGGSNGSATITASGGTGAFTYSWSPSGGTAATATGLSVGTYTCTITDANGCTKNQVVTITQPTAIVNGTFATTNVSCFGGSNGAINLTPTGGTAPYTFNWGGGITTEDRTGLTAGSYSVTITDANSCTASVSSTITQPAVALSGSTVITNVSCNADSTGAINLTPTGGTTPYTFNWGGGITTEDRTGLAAGSYSITITDANSCTASVSSTVTEPTTISSSVSSQTNVSCNAGSNGAATILVSGGTTPYTYSWSPSGGTAATASGLSSGTYTCTITDFNGCTKTQNVTITQPVASVSGTTVVTNAACFGANTGAINLTPAGGTAPYTFNWGGGITTEDRTGLSAGSYSVTITDANGCTNIASATITQPAASVSGTTAITHVSCNAGSNGAINLTVSGGTAPYTFNWGGGITTEDRTGLTAGTYNVTITDANSCTASSSATITQPATALSGSTVVTNVSCNAGSNGAINLTATGGTAPYTFNWGGGITTEDRTGISAGTYSVTITDANGCTNIDSATITQPATALSGSTVSTNASCNGGSNGAINLTPTGGTAPYTFNWGGGITTEDQAGISAGTYNVTITDANSCTASTSAIVTQPTGISATWITTPVNCFGESNGQINFTASGGTGSYTFNWGGGITTEDRTGLSAGAYSVMVTDSLACAATLSISVTEPANLTSSIAITNVSCFAGSDGALDITVSGGTAPYSYFWISAITSEDLTSRSAGTYSVEISDAHGCTLNDTAMITQPTEIISTSIITNVDCFGNSTGAIDIVPSGGVGPYTYNWGGGITTEDQAGLTAGNYSIAITDATSCVSNISITVTEPIVLSATNSSVNIACFGATTGSIDVTVSGGTAPYTYNWGGGLTAEDLTNLPSGNYNVTVTDNHGCTTTSSATLTQPTDLVILKDSLNILCFGEQSGIATVLVSGGVGPYSYNWIGTNAYTSTATYLVAGNYSVEITDNNGCMKVADFALTQNPAITSSFSVSQCDPYTWESNYYPISGTYQQVFSAANGCDSTVTLLLNVFGYPTISISASESIICAGESVVLNATGGVSTATWNNGVVNNQSFVPAATTTYTAEISNAQGCIATEDITVFVRELPTVFMENFADSTCIDTNLVACPFATPAGGIYSGNGVTGVLLNTQIAGIGQHEIIYTYADQYGCANSDTSIVTIVDCELPLNETGLAENSESGLSIYPNPSNGEFTIESQLKLTAIVTDAVGRVIQTIDLTIGKSTVSISNEADGVYFILVNSNQSIHRVVKQ